MDSVNGDSQFSIKATVIRADGKVEELGTVVGGTFFQRAMSYLRIKMANAKQKVRNLTI